MSGLAVGATPRDLIPGDPDALDALAGTLRSHADRAAMAAAALKGLEVLPWHGQAAHSFAGLFGHVPDHLQQGSWALGDAAAELRAYAGAMRDARRQAAAALAMYEEGIRAQHKAPAPAPPPGQGLITAPWWLPVPPPTTCVATPAQAQIGRANTLFAQIQQDLDRRARSAAARFNDARSRIPHEPTFFRTVRHQSWQFLLGCKDWWSRMEAVISLVSPASLDDPAKEYAALNAQFNGLRQAIHDPKQAGKQMLQWDEWGRNPARAAGELFPDVVLLFLGVGPKIAKLAALGEAAPEIAPAVAPEGLAGAQAAPVAGEAAANAEEAVARGEIQHLESEDGSHVLDRHGPETSLLHQEASGQMGVRPDGVVWRRPPTYSSRFLNYVDIREAIGRAMIENGRTGEATVRIFFNHIVGEGYIRSGGKLVYAETTEVTVVFQGSQLKTAFPDLGGVKP